MEIDQRDVIRRRLLAGEPITFPESAAAEANTLPAAWVVEALREGLMVSVENAQITGVFVLHEMQIHGDLKLLSCEIKEFADFSYAVFEKSLKLERCNFKKGVSFDSTRLRSDVWFDHSVFGAPVDTSLKKRITIFNDAEFIGVLSANSVRFTGDTTTSFQRVRFGSLVVLQYAHFEGAVDFSSINLEGDLRLDRATFMQPCNLEAAKVTDTIVLDGAKFSRRAPVSLVGAEVTRGITFSEANLLGGLRADRGRFGSVDGAESIFAHGIRLHDAVVTGSVNLPRARFAGGYYADLSKLSIGGQLDLSEALFKGPLLLNDTVIRKTLFLEKSRFYRGGVFDRIEAGAVNLTRARFESRITKYAPSFSHVSIMGAFTAHGARFRRGVVITNSKIGELTLNSARSYGIVDLSWTVVKGILDLGTIRIGAPKTALDLQGMDVGNIAWFDGARIAGNVIAIGLQVEQQFSWNKVVTTGAADFYELNVKRGVFLQSAVFGDTLKLDRTRLAADVYMCGAEFRGTVTIDKSNIGALVLGKGDPPHDRAAVFQGGVSLQHCELGYVSFTDVVVSDHRDVRRSRRAKQDISERGEVKFNHCKISGVANFSGAKIHVPAHFYGALFVSEALFQRIVFSDPAVTSFSTSTFKARAIFHRARFEAGADFSYARFERAAIFRARFGGKATFDMCRFFGTAEFSEPSTSRWESCDSLWEDTSQFPPGSSFVDSSFVQARFAVDARFDSAQFSGSLDLREATFATLYLPNHTDRKTESYLLPTKVGLVGCRYEHVVLKHPENLLLSNRSELRLLEGYDRQPFAWLEDTLRRAGDDRAADTVYLAGRRAEGRTKPPVSRLFDWTYGKIVNYGVRPWRLMGLALLFVLFGWWFFSQPGTVQFKDKDMRTGTNYIITWEEALNVGLAYFLPVSLPIKDHLVPRSRKVDVAVPIIGRTNAVHIRIRPSSVATILQLAGWLLVPIGVAGMTGVLMRKTKK